MSSAQPQGSLPITVFSNNPQSAPGTYVVGGIDCALLGLQNCAVVLDVANNRLAIEAPCGCWVGVHLAPALLQLANAVQAKHGAPAGNQTH